MEQWRERFIIRYNQLKKTEGLTQEILAERIEVSQSTIANWKNGRRNPDSLQDYEKLSNGLGVHPAWLLYGIQIENLVSNKETVEFAKQWEKLPPRERTALFHVVNALAKEQEKAK